MLTVSQSEQFSRPAPRQEPVLDRHRWSWIGARHDQQLAGQFVADHAVTHWDTNVLLGWVTFSTPAEIFTTNVSDKLTFNALVERWRIERGATSSITRMATCPSYQRMIAMGERVVPLILSEMEREGDEPDQWFWALAAITGVDPAPPESQGDIVEMAKAWLDWGRGRYAW